MVHKYVTISKKIWVCIVNGIVFINIIIGSGQLDFESVIKIIYNFVAKQSSTEYLDEYFIQSENSSNKNRLSIYDFIIFNNL